MNVVQVGSPVEFVDADGLFHHALVYKVLPYAESEDPVISLVFVDLNAPADISGQPTEVATSVPFKSGNDCFYWCHIGQDHD